MNRDYGAWNTPATPETTEKQKIPEVLDYLVAVCVVCERPDNVISVDLGGVLTYAHYTCTPELLDNSVMVR